MCKALLVVSLICFSFVASHAAKIESVSILSKWGGLGKFKEDTVLITAKNGKYYSKGVEIPRSYITNLEQAIYAPIVPKLSLANLGVSQEWLKENTEKAYAEYFTYGDFWVNERQKQLFRKSFQDMTLMEDVIGGYVQGGWTDDYPYFETVITVEGGETVKLSSDGPASFMLPWELKNDHQRVTTYNAEISKAIVNLLPEKFTNLDRLTGKWFRRDLAEGILDVSRKEWEQLKN